MTALSDRLPKIVSTTAFRWAALSLLAFILAAVAIASILFWQTNKVLTEQVLAQLRLEAHLLKSDAQNVSTDAVVQTIAVLSRPEGPGLYYLADPNGRKLSGNLNRIPPEFAESPRGGVFTYQRRGETEGKSRLAVAIPVDLGTGHVLLIGRDIEQQRHFADSVRRAFLVGFGALSVLGLIAGLAVSRMTLKRMDQMTAASRSIMAGDLSQRIPLRGDGGELDGLAVSLNEMLERIEGLMSGLREVSDNIAHDLKTPLNRLRNSAEAALRDPRGEDAYREGLERTIEKADELIKTFNALLLIARLEAGPLEDSLENFDLGSLVEDVAELYMPAAEEAGFHLAVEAEKAIDVVANRQLIGQAIANLIDNAIKYARGGQPGSAITVIAARSGRGALISVGDRGPGISEADRQRVLKRFVRLEESRTTPGTGLGLSLVAAVARLHHGELRLEDNEPGLKVILLFPERVVRPTPKATAEGTRPV